MWRRCYYKVRRNDNIRHHRMRRQAEEMKLKYKLISVLCVFGMGVAFGMSEYCNGD
jgi:hypothetical protein